MTQQTKTRQRMTQQTKARETLAELPDGSRMILIESTEGALDIELRQAARSGGPPAHRHERMEETYEVLEGSFDVCVDGKWTHLEAGEAITVRPGQAHTFANRSNAPCRVRMVHTHPGRLEAYFRELGRLADEGRLRGLDLRSLVHLARAMSDHSDSLVVAHPVQRLALRALGRLAPVLGHRALDQAPAPEGKMGRDPMG